MIRRQIPNIITLCNLLCGVMSIKYSLAGELTAAGLWIVGGIVFDFFDGLAARLLGVASPMGKELDSLADAVTSGVAPGFILFQILSAFTGWEGLRYVALLLPAFCAYRLAKFNRDERQSHSFIGLPAPSNALIWVGLALCGDTFSDTALLIMAAASLVTDWLMVSELPMFSLKFNFKELGWSENRVRYIFLAVSIVLIAVLQIRSLPAVIGWYIILSLFTQRKTDHAA